MSKTKANKNPVEETPVFKEAVPVEEVVYVGRIRNCDRLNVRANPALDAKVLCTIDKNAEVLINKSASTRDFYSVKLASGVSGFCMKKYLFVKKQEV